MTNNKDIQRLDELYEKATPPKWQIVENEDTWQLFGDVREDEVHHPMQLIKAPKSGSRYAEYWLNEHDGKFLTTLVNSWPQISAELKTLYDKNDKLKGQVLELQDVGTRIAQSRRDVREEFRDIREAADALATSIADTTSQALPKEDVYHIPVTREEWHGIRTAYWDYQQAVEKAESE